MTGCGCYRIPRKALAPLGWRQRAAGGWGLFQLSPPPAWSHQGSEREQEASKPDSVLVGHLSRLVGPAASPLWRGALYPGLGEQRQRPCLRLQRGGLPLFTPHPKVGHWSLWPYLPVARPRLASGTLLCAVRTFLSPLAGQATDLPPASQPRIIPRGGRGSGRPGRGRSWCGRRGCRARCTRCCRGRRSARDWRSERGGRSRRPGRRGGGGSGSR
jgi:hypothetical protein